MCFLKVQFKSCSSLSSFLCVDTTLVRSLSFMLEWKSSQIVQRKNFTFTFRKFGELLIKITLKLHESLTPWKQITMKQGVTQWFSSVLYVGSFCVFSLGFSTLISMTLNSACLSKDGLVLILHFSGLPLLSEYFLCGKLCSHTDSCGTFIPYLWALFNLSYSQSHTRYIFPKDTLTCRLR